jgi:hypothetical protein
MRVDALDVQLQVAAVGAVARVGEPDAVPGVDTTIVGAVVALAVVFVGQHGDRASLHVGADHAAASGALLAALAADEPALGVEAVAVGAAAVGAEGSDGPLGVHLEDAVAGDVAEEDVARGIDGRSFEEADDRKRPLRPSGRNGPSSSISFRAASTCSQTFHSSTPRTRPSRR